MRTYLCKKQNDDFMKISKDGVIDKDGNVIEENGNFWIEITNYYPYDDNGVLQHCEDNAYLSISPEDAKDLIAYVQSELDKM